MHHGASASYQMRSWHYFLSALAMVPAERFHAIAGELWQCPAPWQHMHVEETQLVEFGLHEEAEDCDAHSRNHQ